jgi:hypothetical protein
MIKMPKKVKLVSKKREERADVGACSAIGRPSRFSLALKDGR